MAYHVDEAPVDLYDSVLESGSDAQFRLRLQHEGRAVRQGHAIGDTEVLEEALQPRCDDGAGPGKASLNSGNNTNRAIPLAPRRGERRSPPSCTVLCSAALCCGVLYRTAPYRTRLDCTVLYCTILYYTALHCTVL